MRISDEELESISGGWECPVVGPVDGDAREDVDPDKARTDFVNGVVDGGELD